MRFPKVSIIAFITFLSIILNAHWGLTISSSNLPWKTSEVQLEPNYQILNQNLDDTQPERIAQESLPPTFSSMMNQGRTYRAQNNYAKAVEHFEEALTFAQESNNLEQEGRALSELGSAYLSLGNYAQALAYNQECLVVARKLGNRQREYLALSTLGSNYSIVTFSHR